MFLEEMYKKYTETPSDISEHLPTIKEYASKCKSVTEMGVRTGLSTIALLSGCDKVVSYDIETNDNIKEIQENIDKWSFNIGDTREIDIEETDMLFIDTLHNGEQIEQELNKHADKVKKYILFHDTTTFGEKGETSSLGLGKPMRDFLESHPEWEELKVYTNNNGLTIWKRVGNPVVTVYTAIFGGYDWIKLQPKQNIDAKFVCITDGKGLQIEKGAEKQREIRVVEPLEGLHPRLQAKFYRTHPQDVCSGLCIYMDGTARLKKEDSLEFFINSVESGTDIISMKHPERDNILQEAQFCEDNVDRFIKYEGLKLVDQAKMYIKDGYNLNFGLSATGLLVINQSMKLATMLHDRWNQNLVYSYQDQISFEPMVYKHKINRKQFEFNVWNNDYISFLEGHLSDA